MLPVSWPNNQTHDEFIISLRDDLIVRGSGIASILIVLGQRSLRTVGPGFGPPGLCCRFRTSAKRYIEMVTRTREGDVKVVRCFVFT